MLADLIVRPGTCGVALGGCAQSSAGTDLFAKRQIVMPRDDCAGAAGRVVVHHRARRALNVGQHITQNRWAAQLFNSLAGREKMVTPYDFSCSSVSANVGGVFKITPQLKQTNNHDTKADDKIL